MRRDFIGQQMYTRERGGIFHNTDGYDTIAISEGLDKSYIKKYIHPICEYHTPNELKQRGEKDAAMYPKSVAVIQPETGDLIAGQAVFVPSDFTGQRSTFFMHNYVVPNNLKEDFLREPARLFGMNGFADRYNVEHGRELPSLDPASVAYQDRSVLAKKNRLFQALGLDEEIFRKLVYAVISSVASKKKVYITLPVALEDYNDYALQLLELIYLYIPYATRGKFGTITFATEPESKKYVHVMFVENGSLSVRDRSLEKHFVFDLTKKVITGLDLDGQEHEYLDLVWDRLESGAMMDDFFTFAENALSGLEDQLHFELASYYQLAAIYQVMKGDHSFFVKNKIGILHGILKFLGSNVSEKKELAGLFLQLLLKEGKVTEADSALDYVRCVLAFSKIGPSLQLIEYVVRSLDYFKASRVSSDIWSLLEGDTGFYNDVLRYVFTNNELYGELVPSYLEGKFANVAKMELVVKEVEKLLTTAPELILNRDFRKSITGYVLDVIEQDANPVRSALVVQRFFKKFSMRNESIQFSNFREEMLFKATELLLKKVPLRSISLQEIQQIGTLLGGQKVTNFDYHVRDTFTVIENLYDVFFEPIQRTDKYFGHMNDAASMSFQSKIRDLVKQEPLEKYFDQILVAFYAYNYAGYHYEEIFNFISSHGSDDDMLAYIEWSYKRLYKDPNFLRQLKLYLIGHPNSLWKKKAYQKRLKQIRSVSFKHILKEVSYRTSSGFVKFVRKQWMTLSLSALIIVLGTVVLFLILSKSDGDEPVDGTELEGDQNQGELVDDGEGSSEGEGVDPEAEGSGDTEEGTTPGVPGDDGDPNVGSGEGDESSLGAGEGAGENDSTEAGSSGTGPSEGNSTNVGEGTSDGAEEDLGSGNN